MKIPLYRQKQANDCGPVCIQMISAYYNKKYHLKTLKQYCNTTLVGTTIRDIINCCIFIGFNAISINVNLNEAHRMPLPSILYLTQGHFVVLKKIKRKKGKYYYYLLDPNYGKVSISEDELSEKWLIAGKGIGVILKPQNNFEKINIEKNNSEKNTYKIIKFIGTIISKFKKNFIWIFLLTLVVLVTNWSLPLLLQKTIDDGIMQKDINLVWLLLLSQFLFFIGYMLSDNIADLITAKTSLKINIDFISTYLKKIIKLPVSIFDVSFRSDLIQRFNDQGRINNFITSNITSMCFIILNIIVFSIILLVYNYTIFFIFLFFSVISILYNIIFLKKRKLLDYSFFSTDSERRNAIYELIMGMSEIKINNAQIARIYVWEQIEKKINELKIKSIYLDYYMSNGSNFLNRLKDIILTGICAFYVINDEMTIGVMMMISFVLGQLSGPVGELIKFTRICQDAKLSYERLAEIYEKPDENNENKIQFKKENLDTGIQFKNVFFKYPGTQNSYILKSVQITIPIGKVTAIVGSSGSGKTTLLKLILGFYLPTEGELWIDNQKIQDINLDSWREKCGVVMQDSYIFSGSVASNIALADKEPDMKKLKYASRMAKIDEFIERLPMGYNTRIGENGISLSGGEKQRICIARAIYKNPEFLFFDEATSCLDAGNEKDIMNNIEEFGKNKTIIIIAHRLSTVKHAHNIIFFRNGSPVEQGTHEGLLNLKGLYYHLVKNQLE